jgi:hypothetical protein
LPNVVIIAFLNSTVNVTCCLSTLPFSGSFDAAVPKSVGLRRFCTPSLTSLTRKGDCPFMIVSRSTFSEVFTAVSASVCWRHIAESEDAE